MYIYVVTEAGEIHIARILYIYWWGGGNNTSYRNISEHLKICCYFKK